VTGRELGEAIRAARRAAGLTQEAVAHALDVRQSSVSQWERGTTVPRTLHLIDLMRLCGRELVALLLRDAA
jgi:transcriptional regulator with XRE-family HTH domain